MTEPARGGPGVVSGETEEGWRRKVHRDRQGTKVREGEREGGREAVREKTKHKEPGETENK